MNGSRAKPKNRKFSVPRNKPKINWMILFHSFFISILCTLIGAYALHTPDLKINHYDLTGVNLADSVVVENIIDQAIGQNILLFRKGTLLKQLRIIDEIQSVKIGRHFPDSIWITVIERKPIASMKLKDEYAYIGKDGLAFHKSPIPAAKLPVLCAAGCDEIELRRPDLTANFEYAMNALKNVRRERLHCDKISVDRRANMCLNMSSGLLVKLGQPDDLSTKITQLRRTLEYKPSLEQEALYVDVSCPSEKVYMPKGVSHKVL